MMLKPPSTSERWTKRLKPQSDPRLRLFCFPYAGGGASAYRNWAASLPPSVEVVAIQLPGRESRYRDPLLRSLPEAIPQVADGIQAELDRPFAFFGHSLGTLFSFELARELRRRRLVGPRKLIVSGRIAPHVPDPDKPIHKLPDAEFIEELKRLNGTPAEVLATHELMQIMVPVIRADFTLAETYQFAPEPPLECPISVYGGTEDPHSKREDLEAWRDLTRGEFKLTMFPGDHFFVQSAFERVLRALNQDLETLI